MCKLLLLFILVALGFGQTQDFQTVKTGIDSTLAGAQLIFSRQLISSNISTIIALSSVVRDDGNFSVTKNTLTVPVGKAGWYAISGSCIWDLNSSGQKTCCIYKNGIQLMSASTQLTVSLGPYEQQNIGTVMYLFDSDFISLYVFQASGTSALLNKGYLSLALIH